MANESDQNVNSERADVRSTAVLGDCQRRYTEATAAWMRALSDADDAKLNVRSARRKMNTAWRKYEAAKSPNEKLND